MYIKVNEFELLELFESEPIFIGDKEAGEWNYKTTDINKIQLLLYCSLYEKKISLKLVNKSNELTILDIQLKEVQEICRNNNALQIITKNGLVKIEFKPNIVVNVSNL